MAKKSIDYSIYPDFGTQVSDGYRAGPVISLDSRGQACQQIIGTGVPLAPIFAYSGYIASSINLFSQLNPVQNQEYTVSFAQPLVVNNNLSENNEVFVNDFPKTFEFAMVDGNARLADVTINVEGMDYYGNKLSETRESVAVDDVTQNFSQEITDADGNMTVDGYTSGQKAFFAFTKITVTYTGNAQGTLIIRTGNSIGIPFLSNTKHPIEFVFNGIDYNSKDDPLASNAIIVIGDETEATDETGDVRGLGRVLSSNQNTLNGIMLIKDTETGNPSAHLPFRITYYVVGVDLFVNQLIQQQKQYWLTLGTANVAGTYETATPLSPSELTNKLFGVPQNLYDS